MGGFKWFRRKSKPKTIYKDGLRWNLLPKGVYGKEMYVPCSFPNHYWSFSIGGDNMENDNFQVTLKSYGETTSSDGIYYLSSMVKVDCIHYETFKKIVDAVAPILREEDMKGDI